MSQIQLLHDTACELRGARKALLRMQEADVKKGDVKIYNDALMRLLMSNNEALSDWLAGVPNVIHYCDHKRDKRGKLIEVTAIYDRNATN